MVKKVGVLTCFHDDDLRVFESYSDIIEFSPGDVIVKEGEDKGEGFFVILSGEVDVVKDFGRRQVILATLGEGDFFGENDLFSGEKRNATVVAKRKSTIMNLKKEKIFQIEEKHPQCAIRFYKVIARVISSRLKKMDEEYTKLFVETKGIERASELKKLKEKLIKEWNI